MTLTLVLDDSGSMILDDRIDRARAAVRAIASSLRPGDIVSAVTWNTRAATVLAGHRVVGPGDPTLLAVATGLLPRDATDLSSGLRAGYALARAHAAPERLNRVVLITDGEANVGATDAETIAAAARDGERDGIYLVGVGVGDGFNDTLLDAVTDLGRGAYVFLDSDEEASEVFDERFTEVMDVAARAVRLELTLPWYMRVVEFSGEAISGDPRAVQPQHLAPDDAMVFRQVLTACAADRLRGADSVRLRATWETLSGAPMSTTRDTTLDALLAAEDGPLRRGRAIVAWAEALKRVEPLARRSTRDDLSSLRASLAQVRALVAAAPNAATDPGLVEIDALATAYERLFAP
jgi:Ca-activated chloride channel family protein